jgi:hypothetical protein
MSSTGVDLVSATCPVQLATLANSAGEPLGVSHFAKHIAGTTAGGRQAAE